MTLNEIIESTNGDKNSIRNYLLERHGLGRHDKSKVLLLSALHRNKEHGGVMIDEIAVNHFGWMLNHIDLAEIVIYFDRKQEATKVLKNRYGHAGQVVRDIDGIPDHLAVIRNTVALLVGTTADKMIGGCPICGYDGYVDRMTATEAMLEIIEKMRR